MQNEKLTEMTLYHKVLSKHTAIKRFT